MFSQQRRTSELEKKELYWICSRTRIETQGTHTVLHVTTVLNFSTHDTNAHALQVLCCTSSRQLSRTACG
jgi:hypothetical protein